MPLMQPTVVDSGALFSVSALQCGIVMAPGGADDT